jgi:hypothetical protein
MISANEDVAPDGAVKSVLSGFYKDVAPAALEKTGFESHANVLMWYPRFLFFHLLLVSKKMFVVQPCIFAA